MADFDEKAGVVTASTPWGNWSQTIEEVFIEVPVEKGLRSRDINCDIKPNVISLSIGGREIFKGHLYGTVLTEESVWTLEDQRLVRISLVKSSRDAKNCWKSLLKDQFEMDPWTLTQTEKKMALEKFQRQHPGFDFSGADITGNYVDGGAPDV